MKAECWAMVDASGVVQSEVFFHEADARVEAEDWPDCRLVHFVEALSPPATDGGAKASDEHAIVEAIVREAVARAERPLEPSWPDAYEVTPVGVAVAGERAAAQACATTCDVCHGSGASPEYAFESCHECGGTGKAARP